MEPASVADDRAKFDFGAESHPRLDRNEVGVLLVAAGFGTATEHALISLLALNRLRVSEATGADIEALGTERGHRTLGITSPTGQTAGRSRRPAAAIPRRRSLLVSFRVELGACGRVFLELRTNGSGEARGQLWIRDPQA